MMGTKKIIRMGLLLGIFVLAASCSPSKPSADPETGVQVETEQVTLPPTLAPTATIEAEETVAEPEETEEPDDSGLEDMAASEELNACVECHTDQAMLMDTADPVEEVKSENEGAG